MRLSVVVTLLAISRLRHVVALDNGLARTPAMGWNPYNVFSCNTDEQQYRTAAENLANSSLAKLGYDYFGLDCGWQGTARNASGEFTWNTTRIPSGVPTLAEYVHSLGLKFGVYSDAGYYSCDFVGGTAHWLGSLGYEVQDAALFASWGADYLKYDNCYAVSPTDFVDDYPPVSLWPHYTKMRDALNATGRPIVFSMCEWGVQDPARWAEPVGNSWRIANDIGPPPSWANLVRIINQVVPITGFAGPGAWNDLDLLEVGNEGLTLDEQKTHFAFWAAAKSPLLISTDLTQGGVTEDTLTILGNERIVGINQDPLGKSIAFKRRYTNDHDVWAGPLSGDAQVAIVINWMNESNSVTFDFADIGVTSATLGDLWTGASLGAVEGSYNTTLPAHGSLALKLTSIAPATPPSFTYYLAANPANNRLSGSASTQTVNSTVVVVGDLGVPSSISTCGNSNNSTTPGTLTMTGLDGGSDGGSKLVSIDYINADYVFSNTDCSNCRMMEISVNGGEAVVVDMPLSGQRWDILFEGYLVSLEGFVPGTNNTITFSNSNASAPNIYQVGIANS